MPRRLVPTVTVTALTLGPLAALVAFAPLGASASADDRLAPATAGADRGGAVIIELRNQHSDLNLRTQSAQRSAAVHNDQASVVADVRAHGGTQIRQLVSVNAVAAHVPASEVARLQHDPSVARITPDERESFQMFERTRTVPSPPRLSSRLCPTDPAKPLLEPEALHDMHATAANALSTGKGVIVANDGINQLAGNPNFQRPDGSHVVIDAPNYTADDSDGEYYGDASAIAAQGDVVYDYSKELPYSGLPAGCTFTIKGIAPDASLVDTHNIDVPTNADGLKVEHESQIIAGIDRAVMVEHADIISESYGYFPVPGDYSAHYGANDAAVAAGVTVTVSSGDSGVSGTVESPSSDPKVISVGATNTLRLNAQAYGYTKWTNDNITPLSSGGTTPNNRIVDLVAPGYGGEAACSPSGSDCPENTVTEAFGGTSQSCPLVAGAAADVISAYAATHDGTKPTPAQVKQILTGTATDIGAPADQQGAGLVNIDAAVRAARAMPAATNAAGDSGALIAEPSQLRVAGAANATTTRPVDLYNASDAATTVRSSFRTLGAEKQFGPTVTEQVTAPDPSKPVPAEGALAAKPIRFTVPKGVDRMNADLIVPDPTNGTILSFTLVDPGGHLTQISYDYGVPGNHGRIGSTPNIQHVEVTAPVAGAWTATIRWANGRAHLQESPNVPGSYRGTVSFRTSAQHYATSPAAAPVTVPAHGHATLRLPIRFAATPGDHPQSAQLVADNGTTLSFAIARRTLVPSSGGHFRAEITSTVGRLIGQISTFDIDVPAGKPSLDVDLHTADASPDNTMTFWLVNPSGNVVATDGTPTTTERGVGSGSPKAVGSLVASHPAAGRWEIDVELDLTSSGKEFRQYVDGTVGYGAGGVDVYRLPQPGSDIAVGETRAVSLGVTNPAAVGRTFRLVGSAGDLSADPVYIPAGTTVLMTGTITPKATAGTDVTGTLSVVSNTSTTNPFAGLRTQAIARLPYGYTVTPAG